MLAVASLTLAPTPRSLTRVHPAAISGRDSVHDIRGLHGRVLHAVPGGRAAGGAGRDQSTVEEEPVSRSQLALKSTQKPFLRLFSHTPSDPPATRFIGPPAPGGYRDGNFVFELCETECLCEMQILIREFAEIKEEAHESYEVRSQQVAYGSTDATHGRTVLPCVSAHRTQIPNQPPHFR